jgi:hypothetical protein
MNINIKTWYVYWFFWSCRVIDNFCGIRWRSRNRENRYRDGTNLCQFFRTLLLGALFSSLWFALYAWIGFVVIVLPFILFHITSIGVFSVTVAGILAGVVGFIALLWGIIIGGSVVFDYIMDRSEKLIDYPKIGFFTLCFHYIASIKNKFCPTITFVEKQGHD